LPIDREREKVLYYTKANERRNTMKKVTLTLEDEYLETDDLEDILESLCPALAIMCNAKVTITVEQEEK